MSTEDDDKSTSWAYVTVKEAARRTGLTEKAIRRKIEDGVWVEGKEYRRTKGEIYISRKGYERWVEVTA